MFSKQTVVFYHKDCADGIGAAYVAWRRYGEEASYIPAGYDNGKLDVSKLAGKDVVLVDFSFKPDVAKEVIAVSKSFTVIDHHKTAAADVEEYRGELRDKDKLIFDIAHSGAVLAWKTFFPKAMMPRLLSYIEDRDLWLWQLPSSREVSEWFMSTDWTHPSKVHDSMEKFELYPNSCIEIGQSLIAMTNKQIELIARNATVETFEGHEAVIVQSAVHQSQLGAYLLGNYPKAKIAVIWYDSPEKTHYSMRSSPNNGNVDVSEIARKFGGGGHHNAAGFAVALSDSDKFKSLWLTLGINQDLINFINSNNDTKEQVATLLAAYMARKTSTPP